MASDTQAKANGSSKFLWLTIAVGFIGVLAYMGKNVNMKEQMEGAIGYIQAQGDNAMYVYLAFTFIGVVCLVPTTPMEFAGGFLFSPAYGMWTTWLLTCVAKLSANIVSVFIARHLVRDWVVKNFVEKFDLLKMVSGAVKEQPYKMAFLVRGSMVPLAVKNYGLGVLDIGYLPIALCSCIFTPFYALQNIYFGSLCQDIADVFAPKKGGGEKTWVDTAKTMMPIVFNVLLVIFLMKAVKSQMKKQKEKIEADVKAQEGKKGK